MSTPNSHLPRYVGRLTALALLLCALLWTVRAATSDSGDWLALVGAVGFWVSFVLYVVGLRLSRTGR